MIASRGGLYHHDHGLTALLSVWSALFRFVCVLWVTFFGTLLCVIIKCGIAGAEFCGYSVFLVYDAIW